MKIKLKNIGDWIRFRNLLVYKFFNNTTKINRYINYNISDKKVVKYMPSHLINVNKINKSLISEEIKYAGRRALDNRFDLLGSGWICYSKISNGYSQCSIAWNRDFRSGYEWPCDYIDERECVFSPEGTDIKNVWELGRMNYLMSLALFIISLEDKEKEYAILHYCELLKDFIDNNPVGKGVNWILPMEASIRLSNILISFDIVSQVDSGKYIDNGFYRMIQKSIYAHIKFIWNNLEKELFGGRNGNHYYSNVVGLLIATGYIKERDAFCEHVFNYSRKEFLRESNAQFYEEGGHFEQSTGYFKLTSEMLVFGVAMLMRHNFDIPTSIIKRLNSSRELISALKRSNGTFYSFGDCDSGHFIKTELRGSFITNEDAERRYGNLDGYCKEYGLAEKYFVEDESEMDSLSLYMESILSVLGINRDESYSMSLEKTIIRLIIGERKDYISNGIIRDIEKKRTRFVNDDENIYKNYPIKKETVIYIKNSNKEHMSCKLFKSMGVFVAKNSCFSIMLRFGNDEGAGHSHNDTLHYEYEMNGKSFCEDFGTYTYTGYLKMRNRYRSSMAHNVPQYGCEQRDFAEIFGYKETDSREIIEYSNSIIAIKYQNSKYDHVRRLIIYNDRVVIEDYGRNEFVNGIKKQLNYSPSYGMIER